MCRWKLYVSKILGIGISEEATEPTSAEKSSNGLIYGIGGIVLAGIAVLAGILIRKRRG